LQELDGLTGEELLDAILPRACDWAQSLRKIAEDCEVEDYDAGTLRDILRMGVIQMELPTDVDYVRVMSLYKAKGLDSDLVVLAGCVETLLPHIDRSLSHEEQRRSLEEQRRLFYVAITRTRKILVLSSAITMERGAAYQMRAQVGRGDARRGRMVASRFIGELGEECPEAERGDEWLRRVIGE
jgi:superfamily I DNA/RNA helicase